MIRRISSGGPWPPVAGRTAAVDGEARDAGDAYGRARTALEAAGRPEEVA